MREYIEKEAACKALAQDYAYAAAEIVKSLPAADVVPVDYAEDLSPHKNGWWFCCSNCGFGFDDYYSHDESMMPNNRLNFCPCCGKKIKMEESE